MNSPDNGRLCSVFGATGFLRRDLARKAVVVAFSFIALVMSSPLLCRAEPSKISKRLGMVVHDLVDEFRSKRAQSSPDTLAVFALGSDEALERKRVGSALSELITHHLVSSKAFVVVERTDLNRIMSEQRLQVTGAIAPETAVEVGRLVGARALLLGSVSELAGRYQVNVRLVDVQNGEILATSFAELDADLFEKEARSYLVLAPEREGIGLYLAIRLAGISKDRIDGYAPVYFSRTYQYGTNFPKNYTEVVLPGTPDVSSNWAGLGFRYFPWKGILTDLAYFPNAVAFQSLIELHGSGPLQRDLKVQGSALRASINKDVCSTKHLRCYVGLGATAYFLKGTSDGSLSIAYADPGRFTFALEKIDSSVNLLVPLSRFGLEWRPRPRFALAVFESVNLAQSEYIISSYATESDVNGGISRTSVSLYKFVPARLSTEVTLSLYF